MEKENFSYEEQELREAKAKDKEGRFIEQTGLKNVGGDYYLPCEDKEKAEELEKLFKPVELSIVQKDEENYIGQNRILFTRTHSRGGEYYLEGGISVIRWDAYEEGTDDVGQDFDVVATPTPVVRIAGVGSYSRFFEDDGIMGSEDFLRAIDVIRDAIGEFYQDFTLKLMKEGEKFSSSYVVRDIYHDPYDRGTEEMISDGIEKEEVIGKKEFPGTNSEPECFTHVEFKNPSFVIEIKKRRTGKEIENVSIWPGCDIGELKSKLQKIVSDI